jgi:hypothetical protein
VEFIAEHGVALGSAAALMPSVATLPVPKHRDASLILNDHARKMGERKSVRSVKAVVSIYYSELEKPPRWVLCRRLPRAGAACLQRLLAERRPRRPSQY